MRRRPVLTEEVCVDGVRVFGRRVPLDDDRIELVAAVVVDEVGAAATACEDRIGLDCSLKRFWGLSVQASASCDLYNV